MASKEDSVVSFNNLVERYEARSGGHTRALARYFLQLPALKDITSKDSTVLDNACGTAIVCDEIVRLARSQGVQELPRLHAVDVAPNMVKLAESKLDGLGVGGEATPSVMPGEALDFPDETFTHSITNCGILFFKDANLGAKHIFRTLRPGGTAVVTTWRKFPFFSTVIFPAQLLVRPDDEPHPRAMRHPWHEPQFLEGVMREAGFEDVRLEERTVTYGARSEDEMVDMTMEQLDFFVGDRWESDEKRKFGEEVRRLVRIHAERRVLVDGSEGVGFPVDGIVAVCRK